MAATTTTSTVKTVAAPLERHAGSCSAALAPPDALLRARHSLSPSTSPQLRAVKPPLARHRLAGQSRVDSGGAEGCARGRAYASPRQQRIGGAADQSQRPECNALPFTCAAAGWSSPEATRGRGCPTSAILGRSRPPPLTSARRQPGMAVGVVLCCVVWGWCLGCFLLRASGGGRKTLRNQFCRQPFVTAL